MGLLVYILLAILSEKPEVSAPNTHSLSSAPKFLNFEMSRGLLDLTKSGILYSMGLLNTVPELCHLLQVDAPLRSLSTGPGLSASSFLSSANHSVGDFIHLQCFKYHLLLLPR